MIIKNGTANSPDFNLIDEFIWGLLTDKISESNYEATDQLSGFIENEILNLNKNNSNFTKGAKMCIAENDAWVKLCISIFTFS